MLTDGRNSPSPSSPSNKKKNLLLPKQHRPQYPDMRAVTDASGPCETGTTMTFHMNVREQTRSLGGKLTNALLSFVCVSNPVRWRKVRDALRECECRTGAWSSRRGSCSAWPAHSGPSSWSLRLPRRAIAPETRVTYSFGLTGMAGNVFGWINRKPIERGTEDGLANILAMSESAQK